MERIQDNDVKMVIATNQNLIKNVIHYNGNLKIKNISDDMTGSLAYIETQRAIQLNGSADATTVKNEDRSLTEASTIKVKSGEIAYYNSENNHSNFNFINKSNSEIKAMDDNTFNAYANKVHTTAISLGLLLGPFNVNTSDVTLLKSRIDAFALDLTKTRNAVNAISVATLNIDKELHRIKGRLENELDPLVETFIDTAPDFVAEYKAARKLVHYGVRHSIFEATIYFSVMSDEDASPQRLVKITVLETGDKALTDIFGNSILKIALAGIYTITYEKYGFEILTQPGVELGVGDTPTIKVKLIPKVPASTINPE